MSRIIIEAVPADKMRLDAYKFPECGDWYFDPSNGDLHIKVVGADVMDQDEVFLVAFHELAEAKLCLKAGITQGAVDTFDAAFTGDGEPGDSPSAPYQRQHRGAMLLEHMFAILLGRFDYGEVR
ncbi:MAG TPA: hypothetical protein VNU68_35135 [Verrucomicrobiae bacterium]|nr:hypothetical protein [Verrucomicrobiae bacterium]